MCVRFLMLLLCSALTIPLVACTASGDDDDNDSAPPGTPTWSADVEPMLRQYCEPCHTSPGTLSGGLVWLDGHERVTGNPGNTIACPDGMTRAECIPGRIQRNEMPEGADCVPGEAGCPTLEEFAMLQEWIAGGMPE